MANPPKSQTGKKWRTVKTKDGRTVQVAVVKIKRDAKNEKPKRKAVGD